MTQDSNIPSWSDQPSKSERLRAPAKRVKRVLLITALSLLGVVLLLLLVALLVPSLISSGMGTRFVLGKANARIAGQLQAGDLSVGWWSPLHLRDVTLLDPDGKTVLTVGEVQAPEVSLWPLVMGRRNLGTIELINLVGTLEQGPKGLNLTRAVAPPPADPEALAASVASPAAPASDEPLTLPAALAAKLQTSKAQITWQAVSVDGVKAPTLDSAALKDLGLVLDVPDLQHIHLSLKTVVQQAQDRGYIEATADVNYLFDLDGRMQKDKLQLTSDLKLVDVPVAAADRVLRQAKVFQEENTLLELLGPQVEGRLQVAGDMRHLDLDWQARSEHFKSNAQVVLQESSVEIKPGMRVELHVTPAAWRKVAAQWRQRAQDAVAGPGEKVEPLASLVAPVDIKLTVDRLHLPGSPLPAANGQAAPPLNLALASLVAKLSVSNVILDTTSQRLGRIELTDSFVEIESQHLSESLTIKAHTRGSQGGQSGDVDVDAVVRQPLAADGSFNSQGLSARVDAKMIKFPLAVPDAFMENQGMLVNLLGPVMDVVVRSDISPSQDQAGVSGDFHVTLASQRLESLALDGTLQQGRLTAKVLANMQQFPLDLLEKQFALGDRASTLLGSTVTAKVTGDVALALAQLEQPVDQWPLEKMVANLQLALQSQRLPQFASSARLVEGGLALTVKGQVAQLPVRQLLAEGDTLALLEQAAGPNLSGQIDVQGSMSAAELKQTLSTRKFDPLGLHGQWKIDADLGPRAGAQISGTLAQGMLKSHLAGKLTDVPTAVLQKHLQQPTLAALLGPQLSAQLEGDISGKLAELLENTGQAGAPPAAAAAPAAALRGLTGGLQLKADSARLDLLITAAVDAQGMLAVKQGSYATITIAPDTLDALLAGDKPAPAVVDRPAPRGPDDEPPAEPLRLARPVKAQLRLTELAAPLGPFEPGRTRVGFQLDLDDVAFASPRTLAGVGLRGVQLAMPVTVLTQPVNVSFQGLIESPSGQAKASGQATIADVATAASLAQAHVQVAGLPMALVDALAQQGGKLVDLLGPTVNQLTLDYAAAAGPAAAQPAGAQSITAVMQTAQLQLNLVGAYDAAGRVLRIKPESRGQWLLTPAGFAALQRSDQPRDPAAPATPAVPAQRLAKPARLDLIINQLQIGLPPQAAPAPAPEALAAGAAAPGRKDAPPPAQPLINPGQTALSLVLSCPGAQIIASDGKSVQVDKFTLALDTQNPAELITVKADAKLAVAAGPGEAVVPGELTSTSRIASLFDAAGRLTTAAMRLDSRTEATQIPVDTLDRLLKQDGQLVAIFGSTLSLNVRARYEQNQPGVVTAQLTSENATTNITASLDKEARLVEDALATLRVTPALAQQYLKKANFVLADATSAKNPATLVIRHDTFRTPLADFQLQEVVADATLEMGTLVVKRGFLTNLIGDLSGMLGSKAAPAGGAGAAGATAAGTSGSTGSTTGGTTSGGTSSSSGASSGGGLLSDFLGGSSSSSGSSGASAASSATTAVPAASDAAAAADAAAGNTAVVPAVPGVPSVPGAAAGDTVVLKPGESLATFTPLVMHLEEGILSYQEMWVTMDQTRLGFTGKVNLLTKGLRMELIIPGDTLNALTGGQLRLTRSNELRVPISGTYDKPEIKWGQVQKEILQMAGQKAVEKGVEQLLKNLGGSKK